MFGQVKVEHLAGTKSDHAPLLFSCPNQFDSVGKTFRLFKFWSKRGRFLVGMMMLNWVSNESYIVINVKQKIKISREIFGNIFKYLISREEIVRHKEDLFKDNQLL